MVKSGQSLQFCGTSINGTSSPAIQHRPIEQLQGPSSIATFPGQAQAFEAFNQYSACWQLYPEEDKVHILCNLMIIKG